MSSNNIGETSIDGFERLAFFTIIIKKGLFHQICTIFIKNIIETQRSASENKSFLAFYPLLTSPAFYYIAKFCFYKCYKAHDNITNEINKRY